MVLVKGLLVERDVVARPEGLGDHHHQRVRRGAAGADQQFHAVVEAGRIASARLDDGKEVRKVLAQGRAGHGLLVALQAVEVAAQRIDFAVVGDHAERLRQPPAWEGVRAVPLVDHRQGRHHVGVGQVGVVVEELRRQEHPLVDNRLARQRGDVEGVGRDAQVDPRPPLGPLAAAEQPPFELLAAETLAAHEDLADDRFGTAGDVAQGAVVAGHVAPAEHFQAFAFQGLGQDLFARAADGGVAGQEEDAGAVMSGGGQFELQAIGLGGEELVRDLHEDSRPVARRFVGPRGPAVLQVQENLLGIIDDFVAFRARNIHHGADTAGVVLELGIV